MAALERFVAPRAVAPAARPGRLVIAIATYERPEGLARALQGVARLALDPARRPITVVVDNSPSGSARRTVERLAATHPHPLRYVHEEKRGISHARNRALAEAAAADARYLAFLDDDEEPAAGWASALLRVAEATGAAAVLGPVSARFVAPPAAWMRAGRFFDIAGPADSALAPQNTAGNSLIRIDIAARLGLVFDPAFGLSGGEDVRFFGALRKSGFEVRYAADALIHEDIPPARARLSWLARRWYRTGVTAARVRRLERPGPTRGLRLALGGLARLGAGLAAALPLAPLALFGRPEPYRAMRLACRGAGFVAAALGFDFEEYRRPRV